MEIKELYLGHFGKFHEQKVELEPGINVIYGTNEAGKSTLHSFIRGMFFGIEKKRGRESKEELYGKYQPWDSPGAYQGSMVIEREGRRYRLVRNFLQKERSFQMIDCATGRELAQDALAEESFLRHFNELVYRNTISVEQLKAGTEREFAAVLQNFIANLSTSRHNEVDIANALTLLKEKKKELEALSYAAKEATEEETLAQLAEQVKRYDSLAEELAELSQQRESARREFEEKSRDFYGNKTVQLVQMQEKYRNYRSLLEEVRADQAAIETLEQRIHQLEESGTDSETLDVDLKQMNRLKEEQQAFERRRNIEFDKEEDRLSAWFRKRKYGCGALLAVGIVCTVGTAVMSSIAGISVGIGMILCSLLLYLIFSAGKEKKNREIEYSRQDTISEQLELMDRSKEILIRNYVQDVDALRKKYNTRIAEEAELKQLRERKAERIQAKERKEATGRQLEGELAAYAQLFHYEGFALSGICDESMQELGSLTEQIRAGEEQVNTAYQQQNAETLSREEHIRWEMSTIAGAYVEMEDLMRAKAEHHKLAQENKKEIEAVELAMTEIRQLSMEIHDNFGEDLNRSISERVCEITCGVYTEVTMDEQLTVKVLSKNGYVALDKLSAGTNAEIYLAVRLAMADVFFPVEPVPILLDDAFVLYDDERLKAVLRYLQERRQQIILFTCHHREHELLQSMQMEHSYLELSH